MTKHELERDILKGSHHGQNCNEYVFVMSMYVMSMIVMSCCEYEYEYRVELVRMGRL